VACSFRACDYHLWRLANQPVLFPSKRATEGPQGVKFDLNLLLDVDADGDLDILNTEENDNAAGGNPGLGLVWYENPTRGPPQPRRDRAGRQPARWSN
jgi:hypothetical protein